MLLIYFLIDGEGDQPVSISGSAWNSYGQHAFTTGRRHVTMADSRPKGISQTLKVNISCCNASVYHLFFMYVATREAEFEKLFNGDGSDSEDECKWQRYTQY